MSPSTSWLHGTIDPARPLGFESIVGKARPGAEGVITGPQIAAARLSLRWGPAELAKRAKVPLSVVLRAESSRDEPAITFAQLDAVMQVLRAAGASFPPIDPGTCDEEDRA